MKKNIELSVTHDSIDTIVISNDDGNSMKFNE